MINCLCVAISLMCCCSFPFNNKKDKRNNLVYIEQYALLPEEIKFIDCENSDSDSE